MVKCEHNNDTIITEYKMFFLISQLCQMQIFFLKFSFLKKSMKLKFDKNQLSLTINMHKSQN